MSQDLKLTDNEKELIQKLFTMWGNSCQDILSTVVNNDVKLNNCVINEISLSDFKGKFENLSFVIQEITFSGDTLGSGFVVLKKDEASVVIDLIIGGDGTQVLDEFGDLHFSIFSETVSQISNSLIGVIANTADVKINIMPRDAKLNDLSLVQDADLFLLSYDMDVIGKVQGNLYVVFSLELIKNLAVLLSPKTASSFEASLQDEINALFDQNAPEGTPKQEEKSIDPKVEAPAKISKPEPIQITQPAVFSQLAQPKERPQGENIELILDIPITIKAVLGKVDISVREIINLAPGQLLELDKLAGEPVDLIVNDRLVAHGEVVVIDEKFGIKVMDVLSKAERIYNLK